MKLNQTERQYIVARYNNSETPQEISISIGISENAVKRALADEKVINLSWYKTDDQHQLLTYLESIGVQNLAQFTTYRNKLLFNSNPLTGS